MRTELLRFNSAIERDPAINAWMKEHWVDDSKTLPFILVLPLEAQAELNQARVICIADLAHPSLVEAVFRQLEVCVIEGVEELRAELRSPPLRDGKIFQNGEILADEMRTDQRVASDVANTSGSWKGKDCGVKGMVRIAHIGGYGAHAGPEVHSV